MNKAFESFFTLAEQSRKTAAWVIDRIKRGEEPFPWPPEPEPTAAALAEHYMESRVRVNCRPNSVAAFGVSRRSFMSRVKHTGACSLHFNLSGGL